MANISNALEKSEEVAGRLKLIANANRLRIICHLVKGEISVGDIEIELGIKQPTLSREIAKLRDGGVITARRQSKVVFYSLTDPDMRRLVEAVCAATHGSSLDISADLLRGADTPMDRAEKPISFDPRPKFTASKTTKDSPPALPLA